MTGPSDSSVQVEALKPCPHCGMAPSDDLIDTLYPSGRWREDGGLRHYLLPGDKREGHGQTWRMHCQTDYGGCGATCSGDTRDEAIAAWNRRAALPAAPSDADRELMEQALEAMEKLRVGLIQMREHAESYGAAWAGAYVKEYRDLLPGSAEQQFQLLNIMQKRLADVAAGISSSYAAIAALRTRLLRHSEGKE